MFWRLTAVLALLATQALADDRPVVATVNYPLAYFAERLVGDTADVLFPVPADRDPSFWRPQLAAISKIQQANVIALNGAGFATWIDKVSLPRSRIVNTSAAFSDRYISTETVTHSHGADGEHSHTGVASYTWLDFAQAAQQAEALAKQIKRRIPDAAGEVDAALPGLLEDLSGLDSLAKEAFADLQGTTVIATHPRYQYMARAYGFDMRALEWEAGEAPSTEDWATLESLVAETGSTTLLWEAIPPDGALDRAKTLGLTSHFLPPLANRPETGDFLSQQSAVLEEIDR